MSSARFDILKRHQDGSLLWLETAVDLQTARNRLLQLHGLSPGDYFVFDQGSQQIVAKSRDLDANNV